MRSLSLILAAAVVFVFAPALAEPLSGPQVQARAAGGEFRGDTLTARGFESQIWRLAPGGQAQAVAVIRRGFSALNSTSVEFSDTGIWRIGTNTLCVEWAGENRRFSGCYAVDAQQGDHVRLVGPANWNGTLGR
jgi:hypothetical protein